MGSPIMNKMNKPLKISGAFYFLLLLSFIACQQSPKTSYAPPIVLKGETMGTSYSIIYYDAQKRNLQSSIDSFLIAFDRSTSTYNPKSVISAFNKNKSLATNDPYLKTLFHESTTIHQQTNGFFDPTVMPLVNHWGFGNQQKKEVSASSVDSLLALIGFEKIDLVQQTPQQYTLRKKNSLSQLDFNAIAKGYGVDLVGELLEKRKVTDYLVEIGGEMRASGKKPNGDFWKVAIDRPIDTLKTRLQEAGLLLKNQSLASSGNYRNFYVKDGKKIVHTINPKTGYPEISRLLSASIVASSCMYADAYATACMVMGLEKAKVFVKGHPEIQALFIYVDDDGVLQTWQTDGLDRLF